MKIIAYSVIDDEIKYFDIISKKYNIEFKLNKYKLDISNVEETKGFDSVVFKARDDISKDVLNKLKTFNIKYISTRAAGFDKIDIEYAKEIGMKVANVPDYSPNSVSEFTILSLLALIRNYNSILINGYNRNYIWTGHIGKEIRNLNIGIIGSGRIGSLIIKHLSGFMPKNIFVYSRSIKNELLDIAKYVSLDEIYSNSDVLIYAIPCNDETKNIICKENIEKMKKGVLIINTSRGELVNNNDLLEYLENNHIVGIALDVYTNEHLYTQKDISNIVLEDNIIEKLMKMPNVILTPHIAFYTDEAVKNMVYISIENILELMKNDTCKNILT